MKTAAIYARVSSDRQKENHTIASQVTALVEYAESHGYMVPAEWRFQDEGYSGATLQRPGLEVMRDLAAAGQLEAVLIYAPDRLSRKYAYQVLLIEELSRCGVEVIFLKSPSGETPEDQLLVQFQGMIAEYERAQIAERSRRGKRHRAQQGSVNVLSGAPFGYRYIKKGESSAAYYEVLESEAKVVQLVFDIYTRQGLSINAIARLLNQRRIPTRTGTTRWERSTVWGMLRNPAYRGRACFGKTEIRPRQRITRPLRQRNGMACRNSANHERSPQDWIEIAVPPLISEELFAMAQEQLGKNKRHSPRRTIEPTLLQGILVCERCGYALYRTSTRTSRQKIYYYRCLGSDAYRHLKGALCDSRPMRQDYLDTAVWTEVIRLLEDPGLIQTELNRRLEAARNTDPLRQRVDSLQRERLRLANRMERLVTAYQEELVGLDELRRRIPDLRKQQQAVEAEANSLETAAADQTRYLHLAHSLADFHEKVKARADTLDVVERQKILRLLVKEVLVGKDTITIRHSIPMPRSSPGSETLHATKSSVPKSAPGYLLRSGGKYSALRRAFLARLSQPILHDSALEHSPDQPKHPLVADAYAKELFQPFMMNAVEKTPDVGLDDIADLLLLDGPPQSIQRLVWRAPRPIAVRTFQEIGLVDLFQHPLHCHLDYLVFKTRYAQGAFPLAADLRNIDPAYRLGSIPHSPQSGGKIH
jgi:site-specific DNA recombinase